MLRKKNSFRPVIEILERREVPAGNGPYIWTGVAGGAWNDPTQWNYGAMSTPPGPTDDVIFDGGYSNENCDYLLSLSGFGVNMANSISMVNNYLGRLNLRQNDFAANIGSGGLTESCGGIEQFSGLDLNVNGNVAWSGGDMNSETGVAAAVNIQGAAALIQGVPTVGSQLNFRNGVVAVFNSTDTIRFESSAGILVDAQSQVNWIRGTLLRAPGGTGIISNRGTFVVSNSTATVRSGFPVVNYGYFAVVNGRLSIDGTFAAGSGYSQNSGTTDLGANATIVTSTGNYSQSGGDFWTRGDALLTVQAGGQAVFSGGTINLQHADQTQVATLRVPGGRIQLTGTVNWICKVNFVNGIPVNDKIVANDITIAGEQAQFTARWIGAGNPPANNTWTFMTSANNIVGDWVLRDIGTFARIRRFQTDYDLLS
jgi:hypothetical protein